MKITIIGTGSAFSAINYNTCYLLEEDGRRMLIDCGQQVLAGLRAQHVDINSIDDIYISHLHADHIGSLEAMAFMRYDWMGKPQLAKNNPKAPTLYCNQQLRTDLWEKSLRGGMECIEGMQANLDTFFKVPGPVANLIPNMFYWQGWDCSMIQQVHIMTGSTISQTFGLMMERPDHPVLYFTTDAQYCSPNQIQVFYKKADLIFQDCEVIPFCSGVHANYIQLAGYEDANSTKLSADIKAKMWLTHYQDCVTTRTKVLHSVSPYEFYTQRGSGSVIPFDWQPQALDDGFKGFLTVGQVLEV